MRVRRCRQCDEPLLGRERHWCADCWLQFGKGFAACAGAALASWLAQALRGLPL